MTCVVCGGAASERALCERCGARIAPSDKVCADQVVSDALEPTDAALVDPWGRVHPLGEYTLVGRQIGGKGIAILEASVSRNHAEISYDVDADAFVVRDLGSTNGTRVAGADLGDPVRLEPGAEVAFGSVGFYFVRGVERDGDLDLGAFETVRPARLDSPVEEETTVGLAELPMRLVEPTGGGGGVLEVLDRRVQLTPTQFELVKLLVERMVAEADQPEPVRGFVRSTELIARLSWDTPHPTDNHVKQLVRRIRRALSKARVANLIHAQHRFGYRLRVIPVIQPL